jgi:hypothetical protein
MVTNLYTSRLCFSGSQGGRATSECHNFVFDWDHGRVGLAESSCEFEDKHSAENLESADGAEGKTESMDRKLKGPVLSITCSFVAIGILRLYQGGEETRVCYQE